jgi:cysteine desulfurase family protein (TIGR01976 family)
MSSSSVQSIPAIDVEWVRGQFPSLRQTVNGHQAIFLDGPAGTQVPQRVIDAITSYLLHDNANTGGVFATSQRSDEVIAAARRAVGDFLNCAPEEVVFGPNMTTLTFALSRAIGRELAAEDEIVLTVLDHDANYAPWKALEERGVVIRTVDINEEDCTLNMDDLRAKIGPRTKLVAVGYAANSVGTINEVHEIVRLAHSVGALAFIDAVHYAPHGPIDVRALDCDFMACSAYKFFGPHIGILYGKAKHLEHLRPYKVRPAHDNIPDRWETGTQNHECLAGVTAAIDYLADLGQHSAPDASSRRAALVAAYANVQQYERKLAEKFVAGTQAIPGLKLYGISEPARFDQRVPTFAIRIEGRSPEELARYLADRGIFTWNGNFYAINVTERLGLESSGGVVRIGLVHYNTPQEVDRLLATLREFASRA